jgi:hypothetical protein
MLWIQDLWHRGVPWLRAENENSPPREAHFAHFASPSRVRALATEAALATALDTSPAVLVSIYDYAHRLDNKCRRTA